MGKIRIKVKLKNDNENIIKEYDALKNNKKIIYFDGKDKVIINYENGLEIIKQNKDCLINLYFNKESYGFINYNNYKMDLNIKLIKLELNDKKIKVKYSIDDNYFLFELNVNI